MNKKIQVSIMSIFVAAALVGSIVAISGIDNQAFAKKKSNEALQDIGQVSETAQLSECNSGNDTLASCNNVALSFNLNDGNNALAQE